MNGKVESDVKQIKNLLKQSKASNAGPYMALLEYNNKPKQSNCLSPTQIMFGRTTRVVVPQLIKFQRNHNFDKLEKRNKAVKLHERRHCSQ